MEEVQEPAPLLVDLLRATAKSRGVAVPDLTSGAATRYLDHLLGLSLPAVQQEAATLSSEAGAVENELTNLCYREYPTFISVHKCSSAVTSAFDDFSSSLANLLDAVPALEDECRTFARATAGVQKARARAALVQEHQDKLFDLLEIPQLMDTCVRNGYYQEALELAAHTDSLVQRYAGIELVQDVAREVDGVLQLMLVQLLALLREPIKLPALVKTVGYLRRLGTIEEAELSLIFLISRLSNFKTHLVGLERDRDDPARYVRKYVDLFREHVFDIISQFTAIFLDVPSSSSVSSSTSSSSSHTPSPVAAAQLASFAEQCVADLVSLVSASVPRMTNDTAALSSILVQIGYCSLAFARVGLDFAPLVTEPFLSAVLLAFSETVEAGTRAFAKTLSRDAKSNSNPVYTLVAPEYVPILLASEPSTFVPWDGKGAPPELARLPPLALLLNSHLAALNALRLLAPTHLYPRLAAAQASSLKSATQALAAFLRASADPPAPTGVRRGELSAEARAARKAEMRAASVAAVQAWTHVLCPLLLAALPNGIFEGVPALPAPELDAGLAELRAWVEENGEKKVKENGTAAEIVPAVAAITAAVVADSEPAAEELKQNSEKEQAETPVPEQTAATAPTPSTPPATSAPAEASVPEPAPEPAVEPAAEPTVELIEPTTEPVTEPAAEPIAEPEAAPEPPQPTETELTTAPTDEPAHEPTEPAPEPSTETAEPPTAPALQPPDAEPDMQTQADATNEPEADTTPATPASPRAEARTGGVPDDDDVPPGPGAGPGPEYSPEAKGVEAEQREPQQSEPQHEVIVEVESVAEPVEEAAPVTESASPDTPAEPETPAETAAPAEAAAAPEEPAADDEAEGKGETPSESRAASPTPDEPAAAAAGGGSGAAKKKKNKKKGKKK